MHFSFVREDCDDPFVRELLSEMQKECLPADKLYFPPHGVWWIGYYGSIPVAFCCISPSQQLPDGCYLGRAGVMPDYRGNGLHRRMIQIRARWARKQGYATLVTDTTDNVQSANNLIACGFRMYIPKIVYGSNRMCYWRLDLHAVQKPRN